MQSVQHDQLNEGGETYIYLDGSWVTKGGYCVATAYAHTLTMMFFQRNGRAPAMPKVAKPPPQRRTTKAAKAKATALRAAIARAQTG